MYTIRERKRISASPPRGMSNEWTEHQICDGRKIVERFYTRREAERFLAELNADFRYSA
jgi:hypothetical protein